jgi:hypothetical protein
MIPQLSMKTMSFLILQEYIHLFPEHLQFACAFIRVTNEKKGICRTMTPHSNALFSLLFRCSFSRDFAAIEDVPADQQLSNNLNFTGTSVLPASATLSDLAQDPISSSRKYRASETEHRF